MRERDIDRRDIGLACHPPCHLMRPSRDARTHTGQKGVGRSTSRATHPVSRDQAKVGAVLHEDAPCRLRRVDAHAVCRAGTSQRACRAGVGAGAAWAAPLVMIAEVASFCLNSSAAYLTTAVNGAPSGTFILRRAARCGL